MRATAYGGSLPPQKLSAGKKDQDWYQANVNAIIGFRSGDSLHPSDRVAKIVINTNLYWGEYKEDDFKIWTNPYKVDDGFPATPQNINIIKPKIDLLIGEYSKRPNNFIAVQAGDEAASLVQNKQRELVFQYVDNAIASAMAPEEIQKMDISLDWINNFMQKDFKTMGEKLANSLIDVVGRDVNIDNEFLKIWTDYLIKGEGLYHMYVSNGKACYERILPERCAYDYSDNLEFIEYGDWFLHELELTPYQIYDRYFDRLDEEQLKKLLDMAGYNGSFASKSDNDTYSTEYRPIRFLENPLDESYRSATKKLIVYHCVWRSSKKVYYLTYKDEAGQIQETIVNEGYVPNPGEIVEEDWVTEILEGFKVNHEDFYFGMQPVEFQHASLQHPNAKFLPFGGIRARKSLVEIMKPLQYMYILLWYRLELALARDKGKVINMDITQIPKSMGIGPDKWLHYLSSVGVNFINPYEEGWDIPGREGGKAASMNQMGQIDLSMSNVISDYIGLMNKVEDMVGDISGVSKQRQGSITSSELVGNVERSVVQSTNITEPLFWKMNQLKRNSYRQLIECSKYVYSTTGNKYINYITHDGNRVFLEVTDDFLFADFNIYVSDSTKDYLKLQKLESLLQSAMQSGASLHEAAEILTDDSISNLKSKLKEIDARRQQAEQQQQQMQQQIAQQQMQMQAQTAAENRQAQVEDSVRKSETSIQVALIQASRGQNAQPEDNSIEYERLNLDRQKIMTEINATVGDQLLANRQLDLEQQKINNDYTLGLKEVEVKRTAANKAKVTTTKK